MQVRLCKNKSSKFIFVHRLVAEAFLTNANNLLFVNHKDEDPKNNKVDNLEWCTHKYNCNYGNHRKKISDKMSFKVNQYDLNNNFIKKWIGVRNIERTLKIHSSNISECCNGKRKTAGGYIWRYEK